MKNTRHILTLVILLVPAIILLYHIHRHRTAKAVEDDVYVWTRGHVFCGVCKRQEKISYIHVGDAFGPSGNLRYIAISTKEHYDDKSRSYKPFEALATVESSHIRDMKIGAHPGCPCDCRGCDEYGWGDN